MPPMADDGKRLNERAVGSALADADRNLRELPSIGKNFFPCVGSAFQRIFFFSQFPPGSSHLSAKQNIARKSRDCRGPFVRLGWKKPCHSLLNDLFIGPDG